MVIKKEFLTWTLIFAHVIGGQCLQLSINRTPGKPVCGSLRCWNDVDADGDVFSTTSITIYYVTAPANKTKLVSIANSAGVSINPDKIKDVDVAGNVTRYHAAVSVDFRKEADCMQGSFECDLEYVNRFGDVKVVSSNTTVPSNENNGCDCALLTYQLSTVTARLDQAENELSVLRQNNTDMKQEILTLQQQNNLMNINYLNIANKVNSIQNLINTTDFVKPPNTTPKTNYLDSCHRGAGSSNTRSRFLLFGNVEAMCDTETDGGGWIVIQRRFKGDENFYRSWNDYKKGFGNLDTDFWIGNDNIHNLTSQGYNELRVDMELSGNLYMAHYSVFSVDSEYIKYKLTVSGYSGTAGDSFSYHDGMMFSTFDSDNDLDHGNCASHHAAAWWYNACYNVNLNGIWGKNGDDGGMVWWGIERYKSLSFSEMKIRHI